MCNKDLIRLLLVIWWILLEYQLSNNLPPTLSHSVSLKWHFGARCINVQLSRARLKHHMKTQTRTCTCTHTHILTNVTKLHMHHWPHVLSRQLCDWWLDSWELGRRAGARSGSCDTHDAPDTSSHPAPAPCEGCPSWSVRGLTCIRTPCLCWWS